MLNTENAVLVIVDVQGKLAQMMHDRETLFANLQRMVRGAQLLDLPIVWVEQIPEKLGATIREISDLLPDYQPIRKACFSCVGEPAFVGALQASGRRQVLLVGIEAHVCVYQTAIDLLERGYEVEVISDAVGSRIASNRGVGVDRMARAGARISSTEMALFELLGTAEHPRFREVQAVFK